MVERRVFGLDFLRAFAILIVLYVHGSSLKGSSYFLNKLHSPIVPIDGVTIFFVLSGFLIGHILLRSVANGSFNMRSLFEFWIRRWFRTLPAYFMVLFWVVLVEYHHLDKEAIIRYVFFLQNFSYPIVPDIFLESWSLAVEEWFYLLTPLLLFFLMKMKGFEHKKILLFWISIVILFSTSLRVYKLAYMGDFDVYSWDINIRKEVLTQLDSLMYGVLGAYLNRYHAHKWTVWANKSFIIGIIMILWGEPAVCAVVSESVYFNYVLLTLAPMSILLLLPKLSTWHVSPTPIKTVIVYISKISYSMYLIHFTLIQSNLVPGIMKCLSFQLGSYDDLVNYVLYWILTISISALFYKYYEHPMTSLRDKFKWNSFSLRSRKHLTHIA